MPVVAAASGSRSPLPPFPRISPSCTRADFPSRGQAVRAALCLPAGTSPAPAVVVLHGCGGVRALRPVPARGPPARRVATYYLAYLRLPPPPPPPAFRTAPPP